MRRLRPFSMQQCDIEEIAGDVWLHVVRACKTFDPEKADPRDSAATALAKYVSPQAVKHACSALRRLMARGLVGRDMKKAPNVLQLERSLKAKDHVTEFLWDAAKERLSERQYRVLWARFGEDKTQVGIAKEMGVSRQRVQAIEKQALEKLRW